MKIIADHQIPLIDKLFTTANLVVKPAHEITAATVKDADILLVRSVTTVNRALLENSRVRFVGTASAGYDHLDTQWLEQNHITWKHAPGSNAIAVGEYVLCCLAALFELGLLSPTCHAGIIGVGHTGSQTLKHLTALGLHVICYDPPRALRDSKFSSVEHDALLNCDLICLHTPLVKDEPFPTFHLIDQQFLQKLKPGAIIMNAGRGAVVDNNAILNHPDLHYCFDVWEHEPRINLDVLKQCVIATPHIAGHSIEAKQRASVQLYEELKKIISLPKLPAEFVHLLSSSQSAFDISKKQHWQQELLNQFNPLSLTQLMKDELLHHADQVNRAFIKLRGSHFRHEFS